MSEGSNIIENADVKFIKNRIYEVRGLRVLLDRDLAELYGVETKVLNQAVKRNIERFPEDLMFKLNKSEWAFLRSQIVNLNDDKYDFLKVEQLSHKVGTLNARVDEILHERCRRLRTPLRKKKKVSNKNDMEIAVQISAPNDALDQLRAQPSEPCKRIGFKAEKQ